MKDTFMKKLLLILLLSVPLAAHEPLFGLGPHTLYEAGYAVESELESQNGTLMNQFELLYGISPDWAVTLALPYTFETSDIGRAVLRSKYRFYRQDLKGASRQAALHAGAVFPQEGGFNVTDYFAGLSVGYESRRHYFFASLRYRYNPATSALEPGDVLKYDVAYGIRPWLLQYLQPDPVFLVELNGDSMGQNSLSGARDVNSGGTVLSISPGLLFSYRNIMLKAGVKIPVYNGLKGNQSLPGKLYVLGLEFHFPPLY